MDTLAVLPASGAAAAAQAGGSPLRGTLKVMNPSP